MINGEPSIIGSPELSRAIFKGREGKEVICVFAKMLQCLNASLCSWQLMLLPIRDWGIFWFYKLVWKMDSMCCSLYLRGSCGIKMKCFHKTGVCCYPRNQGCRKLFMPLPKKSLTWIFPRRQCHYRATWWVFGEIITCPDKKNLHWDFENSLKAPKHEGFLGISCLTLL